MALLQLTHALIPSGLQHYLHPSCPLIASREITLTMTAHNNRRADNDDTSDNHKAVDKDNDDDDNGNGNDSDNQNTNDSHNNSNSDNNSDSEIDDGDMSCI